MTAVLHGVPIILELGTPPRESSVRGGRVEFEKPKLMRVKNVQTRQKYVLDCQYMIMKI